jgi:DNA-binding NtrC family response regulator
VLEFERDVLVGAGAEVVTSMNVDEAQGTLRCGAFDVVVMNGRMPGGCSVQELHAWIAIHCAGMEKKLLLTFSTVIDPQTRSFLQETNVPSLVKPFEVADLISQVRGLLQKEHGEAARTEEKSATVSAGI